MRSYLLTSTWYFVIFAKIGIWSVSWNPPRPSPMEPACGVMATTGECAQKAAAMAVTKLVMPGPF